MSANYMANVSRQFDPDPSEPIMNSIFQQYERVLVESLITSFGLDFLVNDQHGGDVDTIHNVRQISDDNDSLMRYKNEQNERAYKQQVYQGGYDKKAYHGKNKNYQKMTRDARKAAQKEGKPIPIEDAYTGSTVYVLGKSKGAPPDRQASLDHVISANSIYKDQGRVLAGLSGEKLANTPENLAFTNASLNSSMKASEIPVYIEAHPELDKKTKERMTQRYNQAKKSYEAKLRKAYYTSPKFAKDVAKAAGNVSVRMGARQALGFVFAEMWFTVKEEFEKIQDGPFDLGDFLRALGNGLKQGFERAKEKYKELFSKFFSGAVAGALSSLTTTLCNIFFTTAKNVVRIIRQSYASLVEAGKVLFINPENYTFGERMRAVTKILATGASVVVGVMVSDAVSSTGINTIPVLCDVVPSFCGAFVSGIMSCTLLYFLDRSEFMNKLVKTLDGLHTIETEINYYRQQADYFEKYAAELAKIDLPQFKKEIAFYGQTAASLAAAQTDQELNAALKDALKKAGILIPWKGYENFDQFMSDKKAHLVFE